MKILVNIIAFSFLATLPTFAQQETGIHFETTSFSKLLAKAKKEHKLVFIDCFTTWCGPCKWMTKNIFPNDTVALFYNKNFINTAIDMEKGEGIELAKKYEVKCYPTYLFIDGDGNLVHRVSSTMSVQKFVALGNSALNPSQCFAALDSRYAKGNLSPDELIVYINMRRATCLNADEQLAAYFKTQKDVDLSTRKNWTMIRDLVADPHGHVFQYFLSNREQFTKLYTVDSVDQAISRVYGNAMWKCISGKEKDTVAYQKLRAEVVVIPMKDDKFILGSDLNYYYTMQNWNNYAKIATTFINKYWENDPSMLNNIAWGFYENITDPVELDTAIAWAKRSIALDSGKYYNTDTYAAVLYKRGKMAEAQVQAERAIELAKQQGADYAETEKLLNKIKGVKTENK